MERSLVSAARFFNDEGKSGAGPELLEFWLNVGYM